ncbi:MAG: ATP-binding protein [Pyrinomonadaceae bacterium]
MKVLDLINSFRGRLLLVLAALLVVTLGVQYFLNVRAEQRVARVIAEQEQALAAALAMGSEGVSSNEYLSELQKQARLPFFNKETGPVLNILIVNAQGLVTDSLDSEYFPPIGDDNKLKPYPLSDIREALPPLVNAGQLNGEAPLSQNAIALQTKAGEPRALTFPLETDQGRWYVIVVLGSARASSSWWSRQAARPLLYTFIILLVAMLAASILVWRFTRPIKELSDAAFRVAAGDFDFRVPAADRRDEMGALAARFNEMIAGLGRTRDLEARLNQAERSAVVGRLASAIAHEIRNPLNYINLTLDHLRTAFAPVDEAKRETFGRLADQLKAEVARINTRISEFLNYTRPPKLELRPLDLRAVAEDALRMVEVTATENGIETRVEAVGAVPQVLGDAESLRSVFTNLVINGLQAIDGKGGTLSIKLAPDDGGERARIDITDTGRGIPPEHISQVFEPYFSTKETGTGLGLAIVKKAVTDHGGTIYVISKPEHGTTFTITLPATQETGV